MMSSNGLWKMTSQSPSILGRHAIGLPSGNSLQIPSQDQPIDFSQKSESATPSDTSFTRYGDIRKKLKTENCSVPQNGHVGNRYYRELSELEQYYHIRVKETFERQQNSLLNNIENHKRAELVECLTRDLSTRAESGNPYLEAIRSSVSCPRSDVTSSWTSPRSPEAEAHRANLSSPASLETDSNLTNGRGQVSSPETKTNSTGVCNDEGIISPQMKERLPNFMVPSISSDVSHVTGDGASFSPAAIMNGRRLPKLPQLSIPIMNPLNVRKYNGFSPGTSTVPSVLPYHVALPSPSTPYEDQMRAAQLSNLLQVASPYLQNSILQAQLEDKKPTKQVRPFKAYSNDIINSCHPGMRAASMVMGSSNNFEHYAKLHPDILDRMTKTPSRVEVDTKKESIPELPTTSDTTKFDCQSTTTTTTNGGGETPSSSPEVKGNDSLSLQNDDSQQRLSLDNGGGRKRGNRYPENEKDPAYWERRKKNNEAAKRSRDARRRKEDALALSARELMEDKLKLSVQMGFHMREMQKLKEENDCLKDRELTLKNYIYHMETRCRDCSLCSNQDQE